MLDKKALVNIMIALLVSLAYVVIFFGVVYEGFYANGDNEFYNSAYKLFEYQSLVEDYLGFAANGGSGLEPVSFGLIYSIGSFFSYKEYFFLSAYLLVTMLCFFILDRYDRNFLILALFLMSFYVFIVAGLTQRLSWGVFFWGGSTLFVNNKKKLFFKILALLSHFQLLLIILPPIFRDFYKGILKGKVNVVVIILSFLFILVSAIFADQLIFKISHKFTGFQFSGLSILVWPIIVLLVSGRIEKQHFIFFIMLTLLGVIIGSGRLHLVCFFYVIFECNLNKKEIFLFLVCQLPFYIYRHDQYFNLFFNPGYYFGVF